jgi:hypothetical protein
MRAAVVATDARKTSGNNEIALLDFGLGCASRA